MPKMENNKNSDTLGRSCAKSNFVNSKLLNLEEHFLRGGGFFSIFDFVRPNLVSLLKFIPLASLEPL
jgi:hypothetical protein